MQFIKDVGYEYKERTFTTNINLEQCGDFHNFLFFKVFISKFSESDIKNVQVGNGKNKKDIGFLIPSYSAISNEHDFSGNGIFQKFADGAIKNFITTLDCKNLDVNEVALESLFNENFGVLIISKDRFEESEENKNKLFIELLRFGVYLDLTNSKNETIVKSSIFPEKALPETARIKVDLSSNYATNDPFIIKVFSEVIFSENNHFLQFFYLYQIIETMIEFVMKNEYKVVKEKIDALGNSITSQELKSFVETVNDSLKEKKRINKLSSNYSCQYGNDFNTKEKLNEFIREHLDETWDEKIHISIYEIRNKLFHEFRTLGESTKLATITRDVFNYVLHLVTNYSQPD